MKPMILPASVRGNDRASCTSVRFTPTTLFCILNMLAPGPALSNLSWCSLSVFAPPKFPEVLMSRFRASHLPLLAAFLFLLNGCSSTSSKSGGTAHSITTQPANATVTVGQTAAFSVGAAGTAPLNYQWRKNSANISGATAASYTTPATTSGDNGAKFDVVVSNSAGSMTSGAATLTVSSSATLQSIAVTPASPTVGIGSTVQFTATGTYSDNSTKNITSSVTWASSNPPFATIVATTGLATGVAVGTTEITATLGNVVSPNDTLTVGVASASTVDVVTHHYDAARTGTNTQETILTPTNVNSTTFGKVAEFSVDGQIDGQILYLHQVVIPGAGNKNVLYFATENDSVYAVDADSISGTAATVLWKITAHPAGETPLTTADTGCGYINPVGIMSTPVIDRSRNAIYVVAASRDSGGTTHHRLYGLDLTNGNELPGGPTEITATFPGTGGNSNGTTVTFLANRQQQRAALLESNGTIYTAWSGYDGDCGNYSAWVISFSADTLARTGAIDLVPSTAGAGIWLGGGGPAADAAGNVYFPTGNAFGGNTPGISNDYGDTFVKLGPSVPLTGATWGSTARLRTTYTRHSPATGTTISRRPFISMGASTSARRDFRCGLLPLRRRNLAPRPHRKPRLPSEAMGRYPARPPMARRTELSGRWTESRGIFLRTTPRT